MHKYIIEHDISYFSEIDRGVSFLFIVSVFVEIYIFVTLEACITKPPKSRQTWIFS